MSDRIHADSLCLTAWGGPFDPTAFDPATRAAVLALLQRTDLLAVGSLAGPLSALEALLQEAGPQYRYRCTDRGPGGGEARAAFLYDETRLTQSGLVTLAPLPDPAGPRPYLAEFVPSHAKP